MTEEKTAEVVENTEKNGSVCLKLRGELARELFREGYNCSQAVTLAFADELETRGISREMAAGLASSFGGGLGRLREVCGCVSGMALVCGALEGYTDPKAAAEKRDHYKRIQKLVTAEARTESYYKKRPCAELAACAADILERHLEELQK